MDNSSALTDDELKAVASSGDSSLLRKLTPEEQRRLTVLSQPPRPVSSMSAALPGSALPANGRTGVSGADLMADPAGSLARIGGIVWNDVSDPRQLAAIAAGLAAHRLFGLGPTAAETPPNWADAATSVITKKLGVDPDALGLQTARMDRQAVMARGRIQALKQQLEQQTATPPQEPPPTPRAARSAMNGKSAKMADTTITPDMEAMADRIAGGADKPTPGNGTYRATSPAETSSAPPPRRGTATSAATPESASPGPASDLDQMKAMGLSDAEIDQALRWHKAGIPDDQIVRRLNATRQLVGGMPSLKNLPNLQQALDEVRRR